MHCIKIMMDGRHSLSLSFPFSCLSCRFHNVNVNFSLSSQVWYRHGQSESGMWRRTDTREHKTTAILIGYCLSWYVTTADCELVLPPPLNIASVLLPPDHNLTHQDINRIVYSARYGISTSASLLTYCNLQLWSSQAGAGAYLTTKGDDVIRKYCVIVLVIKLSPDIHKTFQ